MIINVAPQASIATTPNPSSPEEGTTMGVRPLLFGQTRGSAPTIRGETFHPLFFSLSNDERIISPHLL